ncbi:P-loop containing nucleoside triphosphate hydrolase protein [Baffinella frigidus]|nr:P-loop containing nucleoside triphosphate hydrolase protein [Cryptophyta sp. CCMP2293]
MDVQRTNRRMSPGQYVQQTSQCDRALRALIPFGVAFHHAGLLADERAFIEAAFTARVLDVLVATTTLAAGVNLPCTRVVIRSVQIGASYLTASRFKQMTGRAGRPG